MNKCMLTLWSVASIMAKLKAEKNSDKISLFCMRIVICNNVRLGQTSTTVDNKFERVTRPAPIIMTPHSIASILAAWIRGLWVPIPLKIWMFVLFFLCCASLWR